MPNQPRCCRLLRMAAGIGSFKGGLLVGLAICALPMASLAASPYTAVQQGNALYQRGDYAAAAEQYGAAGQALPEAAEIHFNQGNAAYKQGAYQQALDHYAKALQTADRTLEGQVKYNLGNVAYQQALQNVQKPPEAMSQLRSAMTYYRDSLDVDPQHADARYNLELSQLLLQKLQQQQQQQQQQDKSQAGSGSEPPQPSQDSQQSQGQPPEQSGQPPNPSQPSPPPQAQPEPNASPAQQAAAQEQEPPSPPPAEPPPSPGKHGMRPEDATRLLEAIRERGREAEAQRQQRRSATGAAKVEKDW